MHPRWHCFKRRIMAEMTYLDFDVEIEQAAAGFRVDVNCPAGQSTATFTLPFSELELENFLLRLGQSRRTMRRVDSPEIEAAKLFGARLFDAVFADEVRACLRSSVDEASNQGKGLRIRLRLTDAPELADLPWEYLYNSTVNRFPALSVETPVVRYLELPERIRPLAITPPLRVLAIISSPRNLAPLNVEREWSRLREALRELEERNLIVLERLDQASLPALQRQLRRGAYNILHFMGHGTFDGRSQDGMLMMEDEDGLSYPISGQDLGMLLHDHRSLRLALLNACEGARTSRTDPFAGTAQSLVQQGIPAVIAMQFEVSDDAAVVIAHEFYGAVADGYPADAALAEARKALFATGNGIEWGTPVLYLRAPDGKIFDIARRPRRTRSAVVAKPAEPVPAALIESVPAAPIVQPPPASSTVRLWLLIGAALVIIALLGVINFLMLRSGGPPDNTIIRQPVSTSQVDIAEPVVMAVPTSVPTVLFTAVPTTLPSASPIPMPTQTVAPTVETIQPTALPEGVVRLEETIYGRFDPNVPGNIQLDAGRLYRFTGERSDRYCRADFPPNGLIWVLCIKIGEPEPTQIPPIPTKTPSAAILPSPVPFQATQTPNPQPVASATYRVDVVKITLKELNALPGCESLGAGNNVCIAGPGRVNLNLYNYNEKATYGPILTDARQLYLRENNRTRITIASDPSGLPINTVGNNEVVPEIGQYYKIVVEKVG
jgi:hypothetical protein